MWEIKPGVSVGPIYIGMMKPDYTKILGRSFEVFKRFEDDEDEVVAYDNVGVHLTVDPNYMIKQISVFQPNEVLWKGIQLLGRDMNIVAEELKSKDMKTTSKLMGRFN